LLPLKEGGTIMNKNQSVLVIAEIAILTALALVLDYVANITQGSLFPVGGSISVAMVPIMVISIRRGVIPGLVCGLLVGVLQTIFGGHFLEFFQYILDYPIPYMVVGLAGLFRHVKGNGRVGALALGAVLSGLLRYLSHVLAGIVFWAEWAPKDWGGIKGFTPVSWSFFYNSLYMIPSIIICTVIVVMMHVYANQLLEVDKDKPDLTIED
jgi:thiamine transporter